MSKVEFWMQNNKRNNKSIIINPINQYPLTNEKSYYKNSNLSLCYLYINNITQLHNNNKPYMYKKSMHVQIFFLNAGTRNLIFYSSIMLALLAKLKTSNRTVMVIYKWRLCLKYLYGPVLYLEIKITKVRIVKLSLI
jgi:hypothetical protein